MGLHSTWGTSFRFGTGRDSSVASGGCWTHSDLPRRIARDLVKGKHFGILPCSQDAFGVTSCQVNVSSRRVGAGGGERAGQNRKWLPGGQKLARVSAKRAPLSWILHSQGILSIYPVQHWSWKPFSVATALYLADTMYDKNTEKALDWSYNLSE